MIHPRSTCNPAPFNAVNDPPYDTCHGGDVNIPRQLVVTSFIVLLLGVPASRGHAEDRPAKLPNIVYILADDLGYGEVHVLNPERSKIPTPHIDRLAAEGMVFTDAHSGSSVCTPTRYGILTGRYAWRTRLQRGVLSKASEDPLIAGDRLTVAGLLHEQGYHTIAIGKWHLGFNYAPDVQLPRNPPKESAGAPIGARILGGPTTRGFDEFFGFEHARSIRTLIHNDRVTKQVEAVEVLPLLVDHAIDYINRGAEDARDAKPFFLFMALSSPHTPLVPSKQFQGKSGLGDYGDFVMQTDDAVGQILDALQRNGLADNTLVIFTADNGTAPYIGVDELEAKGHYPSGPFRGYKSDIWDGGHRIPFIVRWPGVIAAGTSNDQLTCLTDLMATCAQILGVQLPENAGEDSVSILPLLRGSDAPVRQSVVHHSIGGRFALREDRWKLIFCPGSGGWGSPKDAEARNKDLPSVQLYDMRRDDSERANVQAEQPQVVQNLTEQMKQIINSGRSTPGPEQSNDVHVRLGNK